MLFEPYTIQYYQNNHTSKVKKEELRTHYYYKYTISYVYVENPAKSSANTLSYTEDKDYSYDYRRYNKSSTPSTYKLQTSGLYDRSTYKPSITAGYIYY